MVSLIAADLRVSRRLLSSLACLGWLSNLLQSLSPLSCVTLVAIIGSARSLCVSLCVSLFDSDGKTDYEGCGREGEAEAFFG